MRSLSDDVGVDRALEILQTDLTRTMNLQVANTAQELKREMVHLKPRFRID